MVRAWSCAAHAAIACVSMLPTTDSRAAATEPLARRAANIQALAAAASSGKLEEYARAGAALKACADALERSDIEYRTVTCEDARRRVEVCEARKAALVQLQDRLALDALAAGRSRQVAAAVDAEVPQCPSRVPGYADGPANALAEQARRDRRRVPGYLLCDSNLRALLDATDARNVERASLLATELVYECDARHPDYRVQAVAALIRLGLDANVVLGQIRGSAASSPNRSSSSP